MAKRQHKFSVGQEVRLPGSRIRSPKFANQFLYDQTGVIEKLGWSKPTMRRVKVSGSERWVENQSGLRYKECDFTVEEVRFPMYLINNRWYTEDSKTGIKK